MAGRVIRPDFFDDPHLVIAVVYKASKDTLRYSLRKERKGELSFDPPKYDPNTEELKVVQRFENYDEARGYKDKIEKNLKFRPKMFNTMAPTLPPVDDRFPVSPRERAALFRSLDLEEQEDICYIIMAECGLSKTRIASWLFVAPHELDHIDPMIFESARAELDMRVAKKMVAFAMLNNSPAAMTASLYLTKVFLGWNELGMSNPESNLEVTKSLFDNLTVVQTHRDKDGNTVAPPTHSNVRKIA